MKIIKYEKTENKIKRFICNICNCEWEATESEYTHTPSFAIMHDGLKNYWMKCPCCNNYVDTN